MINLNAATGDARLLEIIDESFKGRILSIFKNSFNVKGKKADEECLITFIRRGDGNIPLGITLDIGSAISLNDIDLKKDMAVNFMRNEILVEDKVAVNIKNCYWYNTTIVPGAINKSLIEDNLKEVEIILKKEYLDYGLVGLVNCIENIIRDKKEVNIDLSLICKKSYQCLTDFFEIFRDGKFDYSIKNLTGLIGLGCGTTPSGDDIILGVITSFYYFYPEIDIYFKNKNFEKKNFKEFKEKFKKAVLCKTTEISEKYLMQALEGNISDKLLSYMETILDCRSIKRIKKATHDLMAVGASSGREIILGTILGLKFCLDISNDKGSDLNS